MTINEILGKAAKRLGKSCKGQHILAIQDTTEVNYQAHAGKVKGLGTAGNGKDAGFFLHPVIAVESQSKALLGLCGAVVWQRFKQKASNYRELPIEQKESNRWLEGARMAQKALKQARCVTVIADRESDIYEEWVTIPDERTHVLTRACRDRALDNGLCLYAFSDTLPVEFSYRLDVPAKAGQPAREAQMQVRFSRVTIKRPKKGSCKGLPETCELTLVDVREPHSIHWRLLTTHPVETKEQAIAVIEWYSQRWQIEQVFRTLKRQGLDVESSQVETAQSLEKLVVIALLAAVQCLQLVTEREGKGNRPAQDVFDQQEITLLKGLQSKLEGKTEKQKNPYPKESLAWSAWIIARLGGWKGYASERPPGPITMLNGLKSFSHMLYGWSLAKDMCIP